MRVDNASSSKSSPSSSSSSSSASNVVKLGNSRRLFLLSVAAILIFACALLTLGYRAVPKYELTIVGCAVIYIQSVGFLLRPSSTTTATTDNTRTSSSSSSIRPLAMRTIITRPTIRLLIALSLLLSVILPWTWLLLFEHTPAQARLLGPHLFLMMTQVLFEIWGYRESVGQLVRIGIPVGFVAYRLRLLIEWTTVAYDVFQSNGGDVIRNTGRTEDQLMLALAATNLAFWSVILLYVLLLKVCPPYFKPPNNNNTSTKVE